MLLWAVGGGILWLYYWEKWYSTTAEEVDGGPHVAAVAEFQDVKSFLGLCVFYQRFVADYATVATPLTNLMVKKAVCKWGEEEEMAF